LRAQEEPATFFAGHISIWSKIDRSIRLNQSEFMNILKDDRRTVKFYLFIYLFIYYNLMETYKKQKQEKN